MEDSILKKMKVKPGMRAKVLEQPSSYPESMVLDFTAVAELDFRGKG